MMNPAAINKADLKKACIIKWRYANSLFPIPKIVNISPSCLKVDKAITFFKSASKLATQPAANIVNKPALSTKGWRLVCVIKELNRITKNTPAVTKVDECTKAETGVGAAMAAGNQAEKGSCALLVNDLIIIKIKIKLSKLEGHIKL